MMKRRAFLPAIGALAAFGLPVRSSAQTRKLTASGSGGVVADINKSLFYTPFTAATGITIEHVPTEQQRMAQLESMVRAGNTTWDVMEISGSDYPLGEKLGLFTPIDYAQIDPHNVLPAMARMPFGVGVATYSEVLIVRTDRLQNGKIPASWADFWDVRTFPGPRALSSIPKINLEFALIADGVPHSDLYTTLATREGLDRAFRKMDQIKPHITRFWQSGAESVQLLTSGEAVFCSAYNGRIASLRQAGIPAQIIWNGGALYVSYIGIPKNAKNVQLAHEFIKFRAMDAARMREYVAKLPYPGFAPGLTDGMSEAEKVMLPTYAPNVAVQFQADAGFWADNLATIQERWNEWMLE